MNLFAHILISLLSFFAVWFFSGLLIDSVDRVAKRFKQKSFTVAFFVLGFITSISEMSVAVSASLKAQPEISAGNLVGASFVILLLIIPFLAVVGNGISLAKLISKPNLIFALLVIILPSFFVLDGNMNRIEGVAMLLFYGLLIFSIHKKELIIPTLESVDKSLFHKQQATFIDAFKILAGGIFIFFAGYILVNEGIYFSNLLGVPSSIIGLLILAVGTNVPEIVIGVRSVYKKRKDIAFGDYLGSAVANTPLFAMLALYNGSFKVEPSEFIETFLLMLGGSILFYFFASSKNKLSRNEGLVLLYVYLTFLVIQTANLLNFSKVI